MKLQQHGLLTLEGRPKLYQCFQVWPSHKPRGGRGYSTKLMFIWGGSVLRSELLTLLHTILHEKGTPFVYPLLTNGIPFTFLVQNFASLLTAVNALSFKQESITKNRTFSRLFKALRLTCQPFWALLQTDLIDRFPYPFTYFNK